MIRPVRVSAPAETPVSLAEAKAHCRVTHSDDDAFITALIDAAVAHLDGYTGILGRCLVDQEWRQNYECWEWRFRLPFPDVSAVTVTYQDTDNSAQTVASSGLEIIEDALGAMIVFNDAFEAPALYTDAVAPIAVVFTAGFGAASAVPEPIKAAVRLLVGHWYENRESISAGPGLSELPMSVQSLVTPYRRGII